MNQIELTEYKSIYGDLLIASYLGMLCMCDWKWRKMRKSIDKRITNELNARFIESDSEIINETIKQLNEYFNKQRTNFELPLLFTGTDFQKNVWKELQNIPYGVTSTYSELSIKMGNIKAIRAIAAANGANAISIIVPCHRIIGSNGDLVGYAGGISVKKKLLDLENVEHRNQDELF